MHFYFLRLNKKNTKENKMKPSVVIFLYIDSLARTKKNKNKVYFI